MIYSYGAEADDPALHVPTWATPKPNVTRCRNLHSSAIYTRVLKHIENEGCMWIQVVKVQSAWAWPLRDREVTPGNREKGKQPEREHSTYIWSIFKLRSGNPKFIIFTTCFFSAEKYPTLYKVIILLHLMALLNLERHLVLLKASMETFGPCQKSLIFGAIQYHLAWTKYAHGRFGQEQMSCRASG